MGEDEIVEDISEYAGVLCEASGKAGCRGLTDVAVGIVQLGVDLLEAEQVALAGVLERILDRGSGLVKEPHKGGPAGHRFLIENLLLRLAEIVRTPGTLLFEIVM